MTMMTMMTMMMMMIGPAQVWASARLRDELTVLDNQFCFSIRDSRLLIRRRVYQEVLDMPGVEEAMRLGLRIRVCLGHDDDPDFDWEAHQ